VTVVHFLLVLVLLTQSCTYYAAKQMIIYEQFFCFVSKYVTGRKIGMIRYASVIFRVFCFMNIGYSDFALRCRRTKTKRVKIFRFVDNMKGSLL